jgi:hypothetical protein
VVQSQFIKAIRGLDKRLEHWLSCRRRLGLSNSFSALLEILDPQRFTRGVPVKPRDLIPSPQLKSDLRHFGETCDRGQKALSKADERQLQGCRLGKLCGL